MKKPRSRQEQSVTLSRLAAGVRLSKLRPQRFEDEKTYNRTKEKRRWHKDQDGAFSRLYESAAA